MPVKAEDRRKATAAGWLVATNIVLQHLQCIFINEQYSYVLMLLLALHSLTDFLTAPGAELVSPNQPRLL